MLKCYQFHVLDLRLWGCFSIKCWGQDLQPTATTQHVFTSAVVYPLLLLCNFCHRFHLSQHLPMYLVWFPSPLSGIMVLVIGVIIPLYADSLSLNPLRSTLCHAWLTCLRWCQVLAVSRRLPYATELLSPPMSVKRMSTWAQNTVRHGTHPETQWQNTHSHSYTHTPILYTQKSLP